MLCTASSITAAGQVVCCRRPSKTAARQQHTMCMCMAEPAADRSSPQAKWLILVTKVHAWLTKTQTLDVRPDWELNHTEDTDTRQTSSEHRRL